MNNNNFIDRLFSLYKNFLNRKMPKTPEVAKEMIQFCDDYGIDMYKIKTTFHYRYERDNIYDKNIISSEANLQKAVENHYRSIFRSLLFHIFNAVGLTYYAKCPTYRSKIIEIYNRKLSLPLKNNIKGE